MKRLVIAVAFILYAFFGSHGGLLVASPYCGALNNYPNGCIVGMGGCYPDDCSGVCSNCCSDAGGEYQGGATVDCEPWLGNDPFGICYCTCGCIWD